MITDFLVAILGWVAGALVNYLADVLPVRRRLTVPFCLRCETIQPWLNYFIWPRRCTACKTRRSWRTWVVELIYIAITLWLWKSPPESLGFWLGLVILIYFGVVVLIDLEHRLIMHPVSIFGAVMGLIVGVYFHGWIKTLVGGVAGFGIMWLLYLLGEVVLRLVNHLRGQRVNDVALGFGDVNLSGVLGLILGWEAILVALGMAVFIGGAVSLLYLVAMVAVRKYHMFLALPYGPFLVAGAVLVLYFKGALLKIFGG
jgi:prepilin signal peptidase PulO-like enzyme (type II secretory pathway)